MRRAHCCGHSGGAHQNVSAASCRRCRCRRRRLELLTIMAQSFCGVGGYFFGACLHRFRAVPPSCKFNDAGDRPLNRGRSGSWASYCVHTPEHSLNIGCIRFEVIRVIVFHDRHARVEEYSDPTTTLVLQSYASHVAGTIAKEPTLSLGN